MLYLILIDFLMLCGVVKYTNLDPTLPTSEGASKVYKLTLLYNKYFVMEGEAQCTGTRRKEGRL